MGETEDRLREKPSNRFSSNVLEADLSREIDVIKTEEMGDGHQEQGHRQKELYREGGNTISLFYFDEDGRLGLDVHRHRDTLAVQRLLGRELRAEFPEDGHVCLRPVHLPTPLGPRRFGVVESLVYREAHTPRSGRRGKTLPSRVLSAPATATWLHAIRQ